jgi:hypothetical protein
VIVYRRSPHRVDEHPRPASQRVPIRWLRLLAGAALTIAGGLVTALLVALALSSPSSTASWIGVGLGALLVACGVDLVVRALRPGGRLFEGHLGLVRALVGGLFSALLALGCAAAAVSTARVEAWVICVSATMAVGFWVAVIVRRAKHSDAT